MASEKIAIVLDDPAINQKTIRLLVAVVAFVLPWVLVLITRDCDLPSVSDSYCAGGLARDVFVGSLFAIGGFLLVYNDHEGYALWMATKMGGICAFGVALIPTKCDSNSVASIGEWHLMFAISFFLVLILFCGIFFYRARKKFGGGNALARRRCWIYGVSFVGMLSMGLWALLNENAPEFVNAPPNVYFIVETACMTLFGVSWMTASHLIPCLRLPEEGMRWTVWFPQKARMNSSLERYKK